MLSLQIFYCKQYFQFYIEDGEQVRLIKHTFKTIRQKLIHLYYGYCSLYSTKSFYGTYERGLIT